MSANVQGISLLIAVGLAVLGAWWTGTRREELPAWSACRYCRARFLDDRGLAHHMAASHPTVVAEEDR